MKTLKYNGEFMPKPRMTVSDKWKKRPVVMKYFAYKDRLNLVANKQGFKLGDSFTITFEIPMPDSWSLKKKALAHGQPHQQRPDVDNLLKGVMDALMKQDSTVYNVHVDKRWAVESSITIMNFDLEF